MRANGQQLLLRQIDQRALRSPGAYCTGAQDIVRKAAAMALTTPEKRFIAAVFGHRRALARTRRENLAPLLERDIGFSAKARARALAVLG